MKQTKIQRKAARGKKMSEDAQYIEACYRADVLYWMTARREVTDAKRRWIALCIQHRSSLLDRTSIIRGLPRSPDRSLHRYISTAIVTLIRINNLLKITKQKTIKQKLQ